MLRNEIVTKIAGVVFSITSNRSVESIRIDKLYWDFICTEEPEVTINARYGDLPHIFLRNEDSIFDSETIWSLYRVGGRNVFALRSPAFGPLPYRVAIFDDDFQNGKVFSTLRETADGLLPNPLEYPLSEVLMVCLLAQGRGLMIHACGIKGDGRGYLFAGNSTHGKTTMARIWKDRGLILNDDRIVLRQRDGRFWIYGTPWHGEYNIVSPMGVPLEKIFFLRHAEANSTHRVAGATAASMLIARCFPPLWDAEGVRFTLDFCGQLAGMVPCYELGFVPDESIVDFVRCVK